MDLSALGEVERDAELLRRDGVLGARWNAMQSSCAEMGYWGQDGTRCGAVALR